jgi:hypothetical protein
MMAACNGCWTVPADIYPEFLQAGETRTRNELRNLRELGFLRKDARGYQLAIPVDEASTLFAYKETPTQRQILAEIMKNGFVYARLFQITGKGEATQFLRAVRSLEAQCIVESNSVPVPNVPHIKRRVYTLTQRARKHA